MKIRADYITNSSSTSFVLIIKSDFNLDSFLDAAGVGKESPMFPLFKQFYEIIEKKIIESSSIPDSSVVPLADGGICFQNISSMNINYKMTTKTMMDELKSDYKSIYLLDFSDEMSEEEAFLLLEPFELFNDDFYINALTTIY